MRRAEFSRFARSAGFTLIELMMTLAILAILAAIAIPSYSEFIMRGRLTDAHAKLGDLRGQMERYFLDNRTYQDTSGALCGIDDAAIDMTATYNADGGRSFDIACVAGSATTYTLTATGRAAKGMSGFTFTVNQANARATTAVPSGWTTSATCWVVRKNGDCS
jgi:type IV pilus assembly protein PilE